MDNKNRAFKILAISTIAFIVCFMVWMIFAVLAIPIKKQLQLSETEFGLLAAIPVLSGSLVRVPLGIWTDQFGGRPVFFMLILSCIPALVLMPYATAYWQFLLIGLFLGLTGGAFSVGTPYVAQWFPKTQQGLAMGIFGAGNAGSALTKLIAPSLVAAWGWMIVPHVYAVLMFVAAMAFWSWSENTPKPSKASSQGFVDQLKFFKNASVLRYSQYYSVVFGGYVALALWMVHYYTDEYGFSLATAAVLGACFSLPGGVLRALGGYLSDKYGPHKVTWAVMWVCWVAFFILSYPQTEMRILTVNGWHAFQIALSPLVFTLILFVVGIAMAIGKASVFKFISNEFPNDMGAVAGIVGLAGGLGGFLLPVLFGVALDLTGIRSSIFMILYGTVCVSLVWMHFSFKKNENLN